MLACEKMDNNNLSPSFGITNGTGNNNNSSENIYIDIPTPSTRSVSPLSSASPGKDKSYGFFQNIYRKISLKSSEDLNGSNAEENSRSSSVDSCSSFSEQLQAPPKRRSSSAIKSMDQIISTHEHSSASSDMESNSSHDVDKSLRECRRSSVRKLLENLNISGPIRSRSLSLSNAPGNLLSHKGSKGESKASLFSSNSISSSTPVSQGYNGSGKLPPKKILRRPVSYTYIRGISGLPTQRVPRTSVCCSHYGR
ncbi:uncharacterized protein LOC129755393 [Uranotaenia lowii]|uniref:uncharacterized protein LOC129755393 n=1 Tax=Uranotaenia lowii TaxID=190385 RepID=UPI002478B328|nr:uncharacterized protein LOC129755393 [Uranotaenia lowii]